MSARALILTKLYANLIHSIAHTLARRHFLCCLPLPAAHVCFVWVWEQIKKYIAILKLLAVGMGHEAGMVERILMVRDRLQQQTMGDAESKNTPKPKTAAKSKATPKKKKRGSKYVDDEAVEAGEEEQEEEAMEEDEAAEPEPEPEPEQLKEAAPFKLGKTVEQELGT
jgi:hypothetical protein